MEPYYIANPEHSDTIYGGQLPICIDLAEVNRLSREWDMTPDELLEQMHETTEAEIAEYGIAD